MYLFITNLLVNLKVTTGGRPVKIIFTKLINCVPREQIHHKPMEMYDGPPPPYDYCKGLTINHHIGSFMICHLDSTTHVEIQQMEIIC